MTSFSRGIAPIALVAGLLVVSACSASGDEGSVAARPASEQGAPDDYGLGDADASEVAAPALALVVADEHGEVTLLDLDSEDRSIIAENAPGASAESRPATVSTDGRLVYVTRTDGAERFSVDVTDAARWTVPHGDHSHSFLGEPRRVGELTSEGSTTPPRITAGAQRTAVHLGADELVLLVHEDLTKDGVKPEDALADAARSSVDAAGPVVPFADHLLTATDAAVEVLDSDGAAVPGIGLPCAGASDADITRVGAVFACGEGAVLFTREVGGAIAAEAIPYPVAAPAAPQLSGRADRPDLAGPAGELGAWLLDVRQRQWTLLSSDVPLVRASAIGDDDSRTVAVDAEGRVRVLAADGSVLARTEPQLAASVADPELRDRVQVVVDADHAYVSDPAAGAVHEIALDDARITRTFADLDPWFLGQVG